MPDRRGARQVVMVAFDGALLLDVTGPAEVFATATALLAAEGREGYRLTTTSCSGTVGTFSGLSVITVPLPSIAPHVGVGVAHDVRLRRRSPQGDDAQHLIRDPERVVPRPLLTRAR